MLVCLVFNNNLTFKKERKIKYKMNRTINLLKSVKSLQLTQCSYSRNSQNILRNRYWYRNKDGQYKEYNESITVIPEEFKEQGIYSLFKT